MEELGRLQTWKIEMEKNDKKPFEKFWKNMECLDLTPILALNERKYKSTRKRGIIIPNRVSMPKVQAEKQSLLPALQKENGVKCLNSEPPQQTNDGKDKFTLEIFVSDIGLDVHEPPEAPQLTTIMPRTSSEYGAHIDPQSALFSSMSETCVEPTLSLAWPGDIVSPVDSMSVEHQTSSRIATMPVVAASFDTTETCTVQSLSLAWSGDIVSPVDSMSVEHQTCSPIVTMPVDAASFDTTETCTVQSLSLAWSRDMVSPVDSLSVEHQTCSRIATMPVDAASFDMTQTCTEPTLSLVGLGDIVSPVDSTSVEYCVASRMSSSSSEDDDEHSSSQCYGRPTKTTTDLFPIPKKHLGSIKNAGKECYEACYNKQCNAQPKDKSSTDGWGDSTPFGTEYKQTRMPQQHLLAPMSFAVGPKAWPGQAKSTVQHLKTYEKQKTHCRVHFQTPHKLTTYQSECVVDETTSNCGLHCSKTGSLQNVAHVCNKMDSCTQASQFKGSSHLLGSVYEKQARVQCPECMHPARLSHQQAGFGGNPPQECRHSTRPHCSHATQTHCRRPNPRHAPCQTRFYWGADPEDYLPVKRSRTQICDYWNILDVARDVHSQCLIHQAYREAMSECHYMYEQAHRYQRCETWEPFNRRKRKQTFQVRDYAECTVQQDPYAFDTGSIITGIYL